MRQTKNAQSSPPPAAPPAAPRQPPRRGRANSGDTLGGEPPPPPPVLTRQNAVSRPALSGHEVLFGAVEGFLSANCNFESSVPVKAALEELGKSTTLEEAFMTPLQRQLFGMDSALRWVLFLTVAPGRAEKEGDAAFAAGNFSPQGALTLVSQVYDIGVQEAVWDHFEGDEDEDDDEDDEDSEGGEDSDEGRVDPD